MVFSFVLILVAAHSIQHGISAPFTLLAAFHFTCQVFSGSLGSLEPHLIRPTARWTEQTVFKTLRRRAYGYSDNDCFYLKVGLKQEEIGLNPTKLMAGPKILSMRTRFLPILFHIRKESSFIFRNLIDTKPALL